MLPRFVLAFCLTSFALTLEVDGHQKEPWLSFGLSVLGPGTGQLYNGEYFFKGMSHSYTAILGLYLIDRAEEDDYKNIWGRTVDDDDDNWKRNLGALLWFGSCILSSIDAKKSADKINKHSKTFGHLLEFDSNRVTLGIDPVVLRNRTGARLTLHF